MPPASEGAACGLLVVDKPDGLTSHGVVGRTRRALGTRKVGHAGTLDPMATGVLVIGVGPATRLLGFLALKDKSYEATIRLGCATVTDDREGEVLSVAAPSDLAAITDALAIGELSAFVGTIEQRPSSVSAVKVDGKRAYDRVRAGEDVELAARSVEIASIDICDIRREPGAIDVDVVVSCSTGTYIRAIARDLGDRLGVGGHLVALRRTRVGAFDVSRAVTLERLDHDGVECLIPLSDVAASSFPVWSVDAEQAWAVGSGLRIDYGGPEVDEPVAVMAPDGTFVAMAVNDGGRAKYLAVFAPNRGPAKS